MRCRRWPASSTCPRPSSCCRRRRADGHVPAADLHGRGRAAVRRAPERRSRGDADAPRPDPGRRRGAGVRRRSPAGAGRRPTGRLGCGAASRPSAPRSTPKPLLAVVGLAESDFVGPAPRFAGCGLEFPYLSVRAGRARPGHARRRGGPGVRNPRRQRLRLGRGTPSGAHPRVLRIGPRPRIPRPVRRRSASASGWSRAVSWPPTASRPTRSSRASRWAVRRRWSARSPRPPAVPPEATVSGAVVPVARGEIAVPS